MNLKTSLRAAFAGLLAATAIPGCSAKDDLFAPRRACNTILATVLSVSGSSGFDKNGKDFDILRELVGVADLAAALDGGLEKATVFAPNDKAFYRLARSLGYRGSKRKEDEVFAFLAEGLGEDGLAGDLGVTLGDVVATILLYHVSGDELSFEMLLEMEEVNTLADIEIGIDIKTRKGKHRIMLEDVGTKKDALILNNLKDVPTCSGYIHAIKDVLVPVEL